MTDDEKWMKEAIVLAKKATELGEIPVGAVAVMGGRIVGRGYNRRETDKNALRHAELIAIDEACRTLGGWRLCQCDLYVTLEPCPMCAGAAINSRLRRVIYGAPDPAYGSCHSVTGLFALPFGYRPECTGGVCGEECASLMSDFFRSLRRPAEKDSAGIIFDLDGTLWDSTGVILPAWNSVLCRYRPAITKKELSGVMGKTLPDIALQLLPEEDGRDDILAECCRVQNELLKERGGILYPRTEDTLKKLKESYPLFIVSNCTEEYLDTFFSAHGLESLFDGFETNGRTGLPKSENIRLIMKRHRLKRAVYVGDTDLDRSSAMTAGVRFIHAAYGFGKVRQCDARAESIGELPGLISSLF